MSKAPPPPPAAGSRAPAPPPAGASPKDWLDLQIKIFLRWVNQRLASRSIKITNGLAGFDNGENLVALMEILSETKSPYKLKEKTQQRVQKMDNCSNALKFVKQILPKLKVEASPENLVDGETASVLGLLWGIMQNYLKFQDDEDGPVLSVKDSLIMWFQNQTIEYNIPIDNVTKSFHNGMILAAVCHRYRPKLIDFACLNPSDGLKNLQLAFDAATGFFGFEQYLTPADILKLDEKCMIVVLSEFFYGIAAQRKIDLAARRIGKVINFTKENDAMRKQYETRSLALKELLTKLEQKMSDRTIDHCLSGAKARLEGFYLYKEKEKGVTVDSDYLTLETNTNLLDVRLAQHQRPKFTPPAGMGLLDFRTSLRKLEASEGAMKEHLHTELNRQIKLADLNKQHEQRQANLQAWGAAKKTYLSTKQVIQSVGAANYQLRQLQSYHTEQKNIASNITDLKARGKYLTDEKFEHSQAVATREGEVDALQAELVKLAAHRQQIADDDLAREKFREHVMSMNTEHVSVFTSIQTWVTEKKEFLGVKETITCISDAELHLSLLHAYLTERKDLEATKVPPFQALGAKILSSEFKSQFSSWKLEDPEALRTREATILAAFPEMDKTSTQKLAVLEDDLAREKFREKLRQDDIAHANMFDALCAWIEVQKKYLAIKEPCGSIADAVRNLSVLAVYHVDKQNQSNGAVPTLKALGQSIVTRKYQGLSTYTFPTPQAVRDREAKVDEAWRELDKASLLKQQISDDDLARELFKEKLRQDNEQHKSKHAKLSSWIDAKRGYLKERDPDHSISRTQENMSTLRAYAAEKQDVTNGDVAAFTKLGNHITTALYETKLSRYKFETPEEVKQREDYVHAAWTELDTLHDKLDDDLKRELFKEQLRLENVQHIAKHAKLSAWIDEKKKYLQTRDADHSVANIKKQQEVLAAFAVDKVNWTITNVADLVKQGKHITTAKYQSKLSSYEFETPGEIKSREDYVHASWAELDTLYAKLDDDLKRELFIELLRLENLQHVAKYDTLHAWIAKQTAYLKTRDDDHSVAKIEAQMAVGKLYCRDKINTTADVTELVALGHKITSAKYETALSNYTFPPKEIVDRETYVHTQWKELDRLWAILDDDLKRELFKELLRLDNLQHIAIHTRLKAYIDEKTAYLKKRDEVKSIPQAQQNLEQLELCRISKLHTTSGDVTSLTKLGAAITNAEYKTELSHYKFDPREIVAREEYVHQSWRDMDELYQQKLAVAQDDLAREEFREKLRIANETHKSKQAKLVTWVGEKNAYLEVKEPVSSVTQAEENLNTWQAYHEERTITEFGAFAGLKKMGQDIITDKYETKLSTYKFTTPEEILGREKEIADSLVMLDGKSAKKSAILRDDLAREQFKEKLRGLNGRHISNFDSLKTWVGQKTAYLNKKEPVNSISDAQQNLATLAAYETEKKYTTDGAVASMKKLGHDILTDVYETPLSRWVWETPNEITDREKTIDEDWKKLDGLCVTKKAILDDDLAREEFRENLRLQAEQHRDKHEWLCGWFGNSVTLLKKKEACDSIADANQNLAALNAFEVDKTDKTNFNVVSLKKLGTHIIEAKYETKLSSYIYDKPEAIKQKHTDIDNKWEELGKLSAEKRAVLDADLTRELKKEALRLDFADGASAYEAWSKDRDDDNTTTHFGFTVGEVERFKQILDKQNSEISSGSTVKRDDCTKIFQEATALGMTRNSYTTHSPDTVKQLHTGVEDSLKKRSDRYATELERQRHNDRLCKEFAELVEPFAKNIELVKEKLSSEASADLEAQVKFVNERLAEDDSKLKQLLAKQAELDKAGITFNPHTLIGGADAQHMWTSYQTFLSVKKKNLDEEIESRKMRGISKEQYQEIEKMFKQFDKSKNGYLDKQEFKACLYSLGDERGPKEVAQIMTRFSAGESKGIDYPHYKEFMIEQLGDTDTAAEIVYAFALVNGDISPSQKRADEQKPEEKAELEGKLKAITKVCTYPALGKLMAEEEIGFMRTTHGTEKGIQYDKWTETVFAR